MKRHLHLLSLLGASLACVPIAAQAQPDPHVTSKGDNAPDGKLLPKIRILPPINLQQDVFKTEPLTGEQLKQLQARQEERRLLALRQRLTGEGYTDTAVQDAIVAFAKEKEVARVQLQTQWQDLNTSTHAANMTDAQVAALLNDFQAKADDERVRRELALQQLSTKIGLEEKPRLKLLLMTLGLIGDEASLVQIPILGFGTSTFRLGEPLQLTPNEFGVRLRTPVGPVAPKFGVASKNTKTPFSIGPTF